MGLTLIHGNSQPSSKPHVYVVAEVAVHAALSTDLGLEVHPDVFDYETFVKAAMSKTISTNNAIVVVSDSLSQRVAPLEAVIALVRSNVVLIPWKSSQEEIEALHVASAPARPTPNTLRRVIFERSGMGDQPARFDGDEYIEEPPDAHVVSFAPQTQTDHVSEPEKLYEEREATITSDPHVSPIDWFSSDPAATINTVRSEEDHIMASDDSSLPSAYAPDLLNTEVDIQRSNGESPELRTPSTQEDTPSFLPEFFSPEPVREMLEAETAPTTHEPTHEAPVEVRGGSSSIESFWSSEPQSSSLQDNEKWVSSAFVPPSEAGPAGQWTTHSTDKEHPYAQSDSLELEAYVNNTSDASAYEIDESTPSSFVPDVAFTTADENGSQQMWTMFDANVDHLTQQNQTSLSEFPDGTDHRKAVSLFEPLVLCVYSPKGGVGKTSISVNLAARLAYTTRLQVCIVDLDIAFGNVGTRLGLYNPTVRELLNEPHIDGESLARNLVYDRRSGLFALLAPLRPETGVNRRKFSPAAYKKILSLLKERFDVVILDCPVELRDPLVSGFALPEAGKVCMVVNNEQATLLDARRAVEAMCRPKDSQRLPGLGIDPTNVGMVVNQKVDNVGREVDDIKAILGGGDPNHPSRQIDILSVIADDRQLWVGNANMARTVATSGENDVDTLLDSIWSKLLPDDAAGEFDSQQFTPGYINPLDEILSQTTSTSGKKKRKFNIFKGE